VKTFWILEGVVAQPTTNGRGFVGRPDSCRPATVAHGGIVFGAPLAPDLDVAALPLRGPACHKRAQASQSLGHLPSVQDFTAQWRPLFLMTDQVGWLP